MKVRRVCMRLLPIFLTGVVVIVVVMGPFLFNSALRPQLALALFGIKHRGFFQGAPSVWLFISNIWRWFNSDADVHFRLLSPHLFTVLGGILAAPLLFRNPNKETFLTTFTIFSAGAIMFGFGSLAFHMQYLFLSLFLQPTSMFRFLTYLVALSSWVMFPSGCACGNDSLAYVYTLAFLPFTYAVETQFQTIAQADPQKPEQVESESSTVPCAIEVLAWYERSVPVWMSLLLCGMVTIHTLYVKAKNSYSYVCTGMNPNEKIVFCAGFIALMSFYVYAWLSLYKMGLQGKPLPVKHKAE
jgi:hypothetical protein